jgi:hypothetical protein
VNLDLAKISVPLACVAEARYKHLLQDRVNARLILFCFFFSRLVSVLWFNNEGENACEKSGPLRMLDCLRRGVCT